MRYAKKKIGGKTKQRSRLVMEAEIGRPLRSDEYVHHRNEDKLDDAPGNLEILSPVEHGRHHHLVYPVSKPCEVCGRIFTPHKTKRKRAKTCSPPCRTVLLARRVAERSPEAEALRRERIRAATFTNGSAARARTLRNFRADVRAGTSRPAS